MFDDNKPKYSHNNIYAISMIRFKLKLYLKKLFKFSYLKYISFSFLFVLILTLYYSYLNRLYLIDEIAEGDKLRELNVNEQTTIILPYADYNDYNKHIKTFVEFYSLCKPIHEIIIMWPQDEATPIVNKCFIFAHTHSKVSFYPTDVSKVGYQYTVDINKIATGSKL